MEEKKGSKKIRIALNCFKQVVFLFNFSVELVNTYTIGKEKFALRNIIIYRKWKHFSKEHIRRRPFVVTHFHKKVKIFKKAML